MTPLVIVVVKASLVLLAALTVTGMLRRRSAALRHWVLAFGILCAAMMPLLDRVVPAWPLPAMSIVWPPAQTIVESRGLRFRSTPLLPRVGPASPSTVPAPRRRVDGLLSSIWAVGTALALSFLIGGAVWLRRLARRAEIVRKGPWNDITRDVERAYGLTRPVTLLQSTHPTLLVTWGILRPKVLLPSIARTWTDDRIRVVVEHELAHIRRGDWGMQLGAAIFRCACWFNPLVWLACKRLRLESEYACDDLVLGHGVDGTEYATHLLEVARLVCQSRSGWVPAPAVAHPSTLEQRISAMLNDSRNRAPLTSFTRAVTSVSLLGATLTVAAVALSATTSTGATGRDVLLAASTVPASAAPTWGPPSGGPGDAALTAVSTAGGAAAQAARGGFSGVVLDQLGGLLPGTDVTLTAATGGTLATVADRDGSFEFRNVVAGNYTLQAQLPGFRTVMVSVSVAPGAVRQRSITLPIGSLEETITVTGERPTVAIAPPPARNPAASLPAPPDSLAILAHLAFFKKELEQKMAFRAGTIGGQIKAPAKIRHVNPIYPAAMQAAGIQGGVSLMSRIGVDGYVVEVFEPREADTNPAPHPDLVAAAMDAVREWRFTPTLLNGVAVEVGMTINVHFSLR